MYIMVNGDRTKKQRATLRDIIIHCLPQTKKKKICRVCLLSHKWKYTLTFNKCSWYSPYINQTFIKKCLICNIKIMYIVIINRKKTSHRM